MTTNRNPIINVNIVGARGTSQVPEHKILVIGQSNDSDVTSGALVTEVSNDTTTIKDKFGAKEHITQALLALRENNKTSRVDAIALNDNGSGVDATGTVVFTGTATESGTLYISIGSSNAHRLAVAITSGDAATDIGDTLVAAINADTTIPVTAANVTGTVTLTSVNAGTIGNYIGIRTEGTVAGVSVALTAMSSGATDPVLTTLFDPIEDIRYDTIIIPDYVASSLSTELTNRFNPTNIVLDGIGIYCEVDTFANHSSNLNSLDNRNMVYVVNKLLNNTDHKGGAILEQPIVIAARIGAIRALRLTDDANIAKYMANGLTKGNSLKLATIPYFNTPITEFPLIPEGQDFSKDEITTLVSKNGTTLVNSNTGTVIILNEVLVTSTSTASSRLNFEDTLRAIRADRFFGMKSDYAQHRLVGEGQERPNQPDVSVSSFKADAIRYWEKYVDNSLIRTTTVEGESTKDLFIAALDETLTVNFLTGIITDDFLCDITTQLLQVDERIIPSFN